MTHKHIKSSKTQNHNFAQRTIKKPASLNHQRAQFYIQRDPAIFKIPFPFSPLNNSILT